MSQYPEDEFDVAGRERGPEGVHREPPSLLRALAPFIAVIVIVPLLAWGVVGLVGDGGRESATSPTVEATVEATIEATAEATEEPATTEPTDDMTTPEATAEATDEPDAAEDVVLTTSVSVLNGAGIDGLAGDVAAQLTAEGFTSVVAADYAAGLPEVTTLYYRNAELAPTAQAIGELAGITNLVESASATQNVEVAIVLRADYAG